MNDCKGSIATCRKGQQTSIVIHPVEQHLPATSGTRSHALAAPTLARTPQRNADQAGLLLVHRPLTLHT
jgi:hypothetical protein